MKFVFVAAHGAGSDMNHRSMLQIEQVLRPHGFEVVRFNFPYRQRDSRVPDRMPALEACFTEKVEEIRPKLDGRKLIIGGRSMGGRVASMMAAAGFPCDGLLLFAYPLHPAGQPEKLRDAHLAAIRCPVLCFNGTRDALCRPDLMEAALKKVAAPWTMHWLEGADHSFRVLKSSGRTSAEVLSEVSDVTVDWLSQPSA